MLKIENTEVMGWEHAIRGMRNPKNSWEKSDSGWDAHIPPLELRNQVDWKRWAEHYKVVQDDGEHTYDIGPDDRDLMIRLRNAGTDHRKFMRMIAVYLDITAPLYWWKEFNPHRAETVANSCSIIHQIADKGVKLDDFSCENLTTEEFNNVYTSIDILNTYRWVYINYEIIKKGEMPICKEIRPFINTMNKKELERQIIQLLPSSYNWKRTLMLNYAVLMNIYISHKNHELNEWRNFCNWIEDLPYSELITGKEKSND